MADMTYTAPGAAFTGAFDQFMQQRAQESHQALLDSLAQKREDRLVQAELDSASEKKQELARKAEKDTQDAHDKKVADLEKRVGNMVKGDRPDSEMVQQAQSLGLSNIFRQPPAPASTESMQPPAALAATPPASGAPAEGTTIPTPAGALTPQAPVYPGSPAERRAEADRQRQQAFIDSIPDDNPRKADLKLAFAAQEAGLKDPSGLLQKGTVSDAEAVFQQNPRTGKVQRLQNGQWTDWNGDVPKGAHFMTVPAPKDTSARDAAEAAKVQAAREHGYAELSKPAAALEDQLGRVRKLRIALDQNTNVADASIMPQLIQTVEGGQGSGVRMTTPLINAEIKGSQSMWDAATLKVNQWKAEGGVNPDGTLNPKVPLVLTDEQRAGVKKYVDAVTKSALAQHEKLIKHRRLIDSSDTVGEVNQHRSDALEGLAQIETSPDTETPALRSSPGRTRYDMTGKRIP
jgi:hypothetical protein